MDHHELDNNQKFLAKYVYKIVDHHSDKNFNYVENFPLLKISEDNNLLDTERVNCQFPRASNQAIVLEEVLKNNFLKEYLKHCFDTDEQNYFDFLIGAIVTDSFMFDASVKGSKWDGKDYDVVKNIFEMTVYSVFYSIPKGEDKRFESKGNEFHLGELKKNLINIKFDEEANLALGINGLMNKDRKNKIIKNKKKNINCSFHSLPVSLHKIINLENNGTPVEGPSLKDYLNNLGKTDQLDFNVIISRDSDGSPFAAFYISNNEICNETNLKQFFERYNINLCKNEGKIETINEMFYSIKNKKVSRKLLIPELEEFYINL